MVTNWVLDVGTEEHGIRLHWNEDGASRPMVIITWGEPQDPACIGLNAEQRQEIADWIIERCNGCKR